MDWTAFGKNVFGGVHVAGKALASAFGFAPVANQLEQAEAGAGLLPDWAHAGTSLQPAPAPPPPTPTAQPVAPGFDLSKLNPTQLARLDALHRRLVAAQARRNAAATMPSESIGWSWKDTLAAFFTGGASVPWSAGREIYDATKTTPSGPPTIQSFTSPAQQARFALLKQKLAAAQARRDAALNATSISGDSVMHSSSDHLCGVDILGAAPSKAKVRGGMTGAGIQSVLVSAKKAADRAVAAGNRATGKGVAHRPGKTLVKGEFVLGAAALTSKQKAAVDKYNATIAKNNAAAKKATERGKAAIDRAMKAKAAVEKTAARVVELRAKQNAIAAKVKRGATVVGEDDGRVSYSGLPDDAVVYDGQRGLPDNGFGSWNAFKTAGGQGDGFVWTSQGRGDPVWYAVRRGRFEDLSDQERADVAGASERYGWGPLISSPDNADLRGLRWSKGRNVWFWPAGTAPAWATAEADAAAALLQQQTDAANQAAADAEQAAKDKEAAEQAEAQAKQAAAEALAQEAADAEAKVAATKQATVDAASASEQAAAQSRIDAQAQQAAIEQQAMQAKLAAQSYQQQLDWQAAHPDEAPMPMDPGGFGGETGDADPFGAVFDEAGGGGDDGGALDDVMGYGAGTSEIEGA